jgi:hypothetical protein
LVFLAAEEGFSSLSFTTEDNFILPNVGNFISFFSAGFSVVFFSGSFLVTVFSTIGLAAVTLGLAGFLTSSSSESESESGFLFFGAAGLRDLPPDLDLVGL